MKMKKLFCYILIILSISLTYCMNQSDPLKVTSHKEQRYNVIIITRDVENDSIGYNRLDDAEINLIFAQLSICFTKNKREIDSVRSNLEMNIQGSELKDYILDNFDKNLKLTDRCKINPENQYSIILFNEMFFSKDEALTKEEVDNIVNCYKVFPFFPKTFLFMNFLYKDNIKPEYKSQLDVSQVVYNEIFEGIDKWDYPFMNFTEEGAQQQLISPKSPGMMYYKNYVEQAMKGISTFFATKLLFNQTKIFFENNEIGYYNKSSYYMESLSDFKEEDKFKDIGVPFYMIGNYDMSLSPGVALPIPIINSFKNLVCYDIDVRRNFHTSIVGKNIFLFASNTYPTDLISFDNGMWICADAKGDDFSWCKDSSFTAYGLDEDNVIGEEEEGVEERSVKQRFVKPKFDDLPSVSGIFNKSDTTITPIKQKGYLEFSMGNNKYKIRIFDVKLT